MIVAAGMKRSGSTWQYNALRWLLERAGESVYPFWIYDWNPARASESRVLLVKIHEADSVLAEAAWRCFTCHRDLRDVAVSLADFAHVTDLEDQLRLVNEARGFYDFWVSRSALDIPYEEIVGAPAATLMKISECLGEPLAFDEATAGALELASLSGGEVPEGSPHNSITLLHEQHRFDGRPGRYREVLSAEAERRILATNRDWLAARGYV